MMQSTSTKLRPAALPGHSGKTVVTAMLVGLVLCMLLVVGLARLTLALVPGPPSTASLSGGFIHAGWVRQLRVGQDYGLIIDMHHSTGLIPRTVIQFKGLQSWVHLGNVFGELGWSQCDTEDTPHRVRLPGGGVAVDFGVGACQVNLNLRPLVPGFHRFTAQAYLADYDAHGHLQVQRTLPGAAFRWQGVVAP